jgi:hypothetical protein
MLTTTFEKSMISLITVAIALLLIIASIMIHIWYMTIYIPARRQVTTPTD